MNSGFAEGLVFDKVRFYAGSSILFTIKDNDFLNSEKPYRLMLLKKNGKGYPQNIVHGFRNEKCFCDSYTDINHKCPLLTAHMEEIYKKLIKHPNIRVKLVFWLSA